MKREDILTAATSAVCGQREQDYGSPEDNFTVIAKLWEAYISAKCVSDGADICIDAEDIAMLMILLKVARTASGNYHADNYVDIAGYAACAGEIAGRGIEPDRPAKPDTAAMRKRLEAWREMVPADVRAAGLMSDGYDEDYALLVAHAPHDLRVMVDWAEGQ